VFGSQHPPAIDANLGVFLLWNAPDNFFGGQAAISASKWITA
jgi:hypothetical protein